jgi:hypothetical protein
MMEKEIQDSLKVSSYKDAILDAILNKKGKNFKVEVPQYGNGPASSTNNESNSLFSMDPRNNDYMAAVAAAALGDRGVAAALSANPSLTRYASNLPEDAITDQQLLEQAQQQMQAPSQPQHAVSGRQWRAIQKYPALVEFLGTDDAEPIVRHIAEKVNELLVIKIGQNSKGVSKFAEACIAERHNIKQFFVGPDKQWVCCVIASGPFRGDEAIYFDQERGKAFVIRQIGKQYEDVSDKFDIVHEYAEGSIPCAESQSS